MVDPENATPGDRTQDPPAGEELQSLLRDALAATKRSHEDISEQKRQYASPWKKVDSLQQGGMTEEGKKARIAPGELHSCVLKRSDMHSLMLETYPAASVEILLHINMGALMDHRWVPDSLGRDGPTTSSCLCQSTGSSEAP